MHSSQPGAAGLSCELLVCRMLEVSLRWQSFVQLCTLCACTHTVLMPAPCAMQEPARAAAAHLLPDGFLHLIWDPICLGYVEAHINLGVDLHSKQHEVQQAGTSRAAAVGPCS